MEGPPNAAIRFALSSSYFMCRHCRNHVLSFQNCLCEVIRSQAIFCQSPVNVWVDDIMLRMYINNWPVLNVCCDVCNMNLGLMFAMVTPTNSVLLDGKVIFYLNKLLFWNGMILVYADTRMPVRPN